MDIFVLILRLGLVGVFGVAGIAKLFDPQGAGKAFTEFGLPKVLVKPMTVVLPAVEIAIAVSLLFVTSSWYAAMAGVVLLGSFTIGMLVQMAKGNAPDCHCFGQLHSEPVGVSSVVRNIVFLAGAVLVATRGASGQGAGLVSGEQDMAIVIVGIAVVALLLVAVVFLKKIAEQQTQIMRRIDLLEIIAQEGGVKREDAGHPQDGLPIGGIVPEFTGKDLTGAAVTLADLKSEGKPVLFVYVGPKCAPCEALIPDLAAWQKEFAAEVELVLVSSGTATENIAKFGDSLAPAIILQADKEVSDLLHARWTPSAILMRPNGRVASHIAAGGDSIRELVGTLRQSLAGSPVGPYTNDEHARVKVGEMVPEVDISDISGRSITSEDFRGRQTLVTFWSTACPHCSNMLPEIQEWDAANGPEGPNMLIFSDGDVETLRSYGLASASIVLDEGHKTASTFGMFGTPSAVLIDENGFFISETAVGADNVWSLIGRQKTNGNGNGHRH